MKKKFVVAVALMIGAACAVAAPAAPAPASDKATAKEAETMVKKAVEYLRAQGKDKALLEMSNKKGLFVDRDLYLSVYKFDGTNVAHGANEKMIGKNFLELKDSDGKEYVRERMELAKAKGKFWQDYKFVNPVSKKIEPKAMYCERADDLIVCGGIYKPV
ncbi:MAG: cache domain-containing protein [Telluria sp.]|nr:cache domain-containing protein [Telluria sp.]